MKWRLEFPFQLQSAGKALGRDAPGYGQPPVSRAAQQRRDGRQDESAGVKVAVSFLWRQGPGKDADSPICSNSPPIWAGVMGQRAAGHWVSP